MNANRNSKAVHHNFAEIESEFNIRASSLMGTCALIERFALEIDDLALAGSMAGLYQMAKEADTLFDELLQLYLREKRTGEGA